MATGSAPVMMSFCSTSIVMDSSSRVETKSATAVTVGASNRWTTCCQCPAPACMLPPPARPVIGCPMLARTVTEPSLAKPAPAANDAVRTAACPDAPGGADMQSRLISTNGRSETGSLILSIVESSWSGSRTVRGGRSTGSDLCREPRELLLNVVQQFLLLSQCCAQI